MAKRAQVLIPIAIAAAIIGIAGIVSLPSEVKLQQVDFPVGTIKIDDIVLSVKIADTDANMARGLMFEEKLPYDKGMLFVFDKPETRSMWMLNMQFNIDVIWFDGNGNVVSIDRNVPPCMTTVEIFVCKENGVSSDNAQYVLEVTAGFVDKFEITEDSKLELISI